MPNAVRSYRDDADALFPGDRIPFPGLQAGVPSAPTTLRVWNNYQGTGVVNTIWNPRLTVEARPLGDLGDFQPEGLAALDEGAVQAQLVGGSAELNVVRSAVYRLGRGQAIPLPNVPGPIGGNYVEIELVVHLPAGVDTSSVELDWRLLESRSRPMGDRHVPNAVITGRGESTTTRVIRGEPITPRAPADDFVTVPAESWYHRGSGPWTEGGQDLQLDDLDFNGAALLAGEAYVALLYYADAQGVQVLKGVKDVAASTVKPAVPADALPRAWVTRGFDGVITVAEIEETREGAPYYWTATASGLDVTVGPGAGYADGRLVETSGGDLLTVPDSVTTDLYVTHDGSFALVAQGGVLDGNPMRLWTFEADAVEIVDVIDRRPIEGGGFAS